MPLDAARVARAVLPYPAAAGRCGRDREVDGRSRYRCRRPRVTDSRPPAATQRSSPRTVPSADLERNTPTGPCTLGAGLSSDGDLLVDFDAEASLLDQVGLTQDLEALLGLHVDVISAGGLSTRHRHIRDEAIDL